MLYPLSYRRREHSRPDYRPDKRSLRCVLPQAEATTGKDHPPAIHRDSFDLRYRRGDLARRTCRAAGFVA